MQVLESDDTENIDEDNPQKQCLHQNNIILFQGLKNGVLLEDVCQQSGIDELLKEGADRQKHVDWLIKLHML